jgi:polyisoprenoid-binding protein YceI
MALDKTLLPVILGWALLSAGLQDLASAEEPCAPFANANVDQSRVAAMRAAAKGGHLYRIQPGTSRVGFCVKSEIAVVKAEFKDFQGGLTLWPNHRSNKEQAMVMVKTASLDTGGSMLESLLKSERFFDVANYPEILFVSTRFTWTGDTTGVLKGDLTLHGVTRPVTFNVTLLPVISKEDKRKSAGTVLVKAGTTIRRSDFGMDTLSRVVDDDVELCMSVEAVRYKG